MKITSLRLIVQHLAFLVSTYGGGRGISLGAYVPCLSCPFIYSCSGFCYLLIFQRTLGTLLTPVIWLAGGDTGPLDWDNFIGFWKGLLIFSLLVILLGKSWCGWLCPFGLVQDWITRLRRLLRVRESELSLRAKERISLIKYALLLLLVVALPVAASTGALPQEFLLAFCGICPAKAVMPLFGGDAQYLALDYSSGAALGFSIALLLVTGAILVASFVKDRFFCMICPMLALINLYRRLYVMRLVKSPPSCRGCGNCRRTCSMDNDTVYRERETAYVYDADCMGCFKCSEGCPSDGSLSVKFGPFSLFRSSRKYAAGRSK
ncbi:MAG: 4Fe-4S binding protein [Deltaproteobacteria bacterium]|nr:4Fe-4S binding protein [Deltaproteobacteria bacterium]